MQPLRFLGRTILAGLLVLAPIFLTGLLIAKGFESVASVVKPWRKALPHWLPNEEALSVLLLLTLCFLVGLAMRTGLGRWMQQKLDANLLSRIPGYTQIRDLALQVAGNTQQNVWKPALVQFDDGLVQAFLVEECSDELVTVFVPAIPSVLTGEVFIVDRKRVHLLDVPFATALKSISHWGAGSKELVAAYSRISQHRSSDSAGAS
ncbi:MAG: DUF502 domain-containing protein [Planctomycetota bacterium]|jgi:uncharacterized membrane protein